MNMNGIEINKAAIEEEMAKAFEELYAEEIAEEEIVRDYPTVPSNRAQRRRETTKKAAKRALPLGYAKGSIEYGKCRNHSVATHIDVSKGRNRVVTAQVKIDAMQEILEDNNFKKELVEDARHQERRYIVDDIEAKADDIINNIKNWDCMQMKFAEIKL